MSVNINQTTIPELAQWIKEGKITSKEVVARCVANYKKNARLNAFIIFFEKEALAKAKEIDAKIKRSEKTGKLAGVPFSVKDNIFTKGTATTAGTPALKDFIPDTNSGLLQQLLDEDAILIGKTNMHELAFGITSLNPYAGFVKNPVNDALIAGGSSGGAAASVITGACIFAVGTDTGGSVRIPSALTGLFGFRPTIENYRNDGLINISKTRDTQGLIAKNIDDIIYLNDILNIHPQQVEQKDIKTYKIGFPKKYYRENLSPGVQEVFDNAIARLKNKGVNLMEIDIAEIGKLNETVSFPVVLYETKQELTRLLKKLDKPISAKDFVSKIASPDMKGAMEMVFGKDGISKKVYNKALNVDRKKLIKTIRNYFTENQLDAVVFPTTIIEATSITENLTGNITLNGKKAPVFLTYINNTDPGSNSNMPGITIPIGLTNAKLPVGLELDGLTGKDNQLLVLAKKITECLK